MQDIDILEDNAQECRERLSSILEERYQLIFKDSFSDELLKCIRFMLDKNIIQLLNLNSMYHLSI